VTVCVDASLLLKCLLYEPGSEAAIAWLEVHKGEDMVEPWTLLAEVASVIRRKALQDEISVAEGREALFFLDSLGVRLLADFALVQRAYDLAGEIGQPSVHDTLYLAVAERERCDLWTSDARFARAASRYRYVRFCGPS
jgi:predicted nucleic acid-binding protein